MPPLVVPPGCHAPPLTSFCTLQSVIGAVLQKANDLLEITEDMEDIAPARNLGTETGTQVVVRGRGTETGRTDLAGRDHAVKTEEKNRAKEYLWLLSTPVQCTGTLAKEEGSG